MSRLTRRLIAGTFILLFFGLGPLAVIYSRGWRWQASTEPWRPTGTLIVSSSPNAAQIYLDNKLLSGSTPLTLTALPPQRYTVRLSAPGYHDWQKTLPVNAGQATFISNVRLLKSALPTLLANQSEIISSHGSTVLFFVSGNQPTHLALFNTDTQVTTHLSALARPKDWHITWSDDGAAAALVLDKKIVYIDVNAATSTSFLTAATPQALVFDAGTNNSLLFTTGADFWRLNASRGSIQKVALRHPSPDSIVSEIWHINNRRFELTKTLTGNTEDYSLVVRDDAEKILYNLALPEHIPYRYLGTIADNLILLSERGDLYIARYQDGALQKRLNISGVRETDINSGAQTITYATDFEIWTYQANQESPELLTRLATAITGVRLLPGATHIIYSAGTEVRALEWDGRDVRNNWLLANLSEINSITTTADSRSLLITGQIGKQTGVFNLEI